MQGSYLLYPDGIYKEVGERVNYLLCKYDEFRSMGLDDELFQRLTSEQLRHEDRVGQLITALEGSWHIKKDMNANNRIYILSESAKRLDADYKVSRQRLFLSAHLCTCVAILSRKTTKNKGRGRGHCVSFFSLSRMPPV